MEIGGEFHEKQGERFPFVTYIKDSCIKTLLGRTAIDVAIQDILTTSKPTKVLMPDYCCHTMIQPFLDNHISVVFYPVTLDRTIEIDLLHYDKVDILFIMEYFGYKQEISIKNRTDELVINDTTHSIFTNSSKIGDYYVTSIRKWMPTTVAFAMKNNGDFADYISR